jgi:hypothetical protein
VRGCAAHSYMFAAWLNALDRYDVHPGGSVRRGIAIVAAGLSAFFLFYTVRLFAVTSFLRRTRPGGGGAYVGAVVFPFLALAFGWAAYRAWNLSGASSRHRLSNDR